MLGSAPLEAVLGSGIDNRDHDAVRAFVRSAADLGLAVLFIAPESKVPVDLRTPQKRKADDKAAQEAARDAGRPDWARVKSAAGLALASSDKTVLDRYLKRYLSLYADRYPDGVPVNLAVEVGASGLVVIDCDTAAQMERWFEVSECPPEERPAPTVITPGHMGEGADPDDPETWSHSDGGHFWFTVPDKYMPVLPRHIGAMTWGGDHGFAVLWDRRYVLIPPSTRPEGGYEQLGHVYELPSWLAEAIIQAGERRVDRAKRTEADREEGDLADAVDSWAEGVSWAAILEPLGWTPAPRADACGCAVWTAPGVHASPKSATAHDTGCMAGRYTEVNAPLHIWTDNPAEPFDQWIEEKGTATISKLQAVALISYGGNVGKALDDMGITPDLSVEPGLDPKGPDADLDKTGDGSFDLPESETAVREQQMANEGLADPQPEPTASADPFCRLCATSDGEFAADEAGVLWHRGDDGDGHLADAEPPRESVPTEGFAADLSDLPADFGKADRASGASPYPDDVDDPDPDVFDSKHKGVPRIAPFSHWREMPPPEFIIDGLIEHGGLSCVIGSPGVGKSTVALDMACHIATGKRWQGRQTLKTRVLYLPGEGLAGAVQRLRAWEAAHDIELDDNLLLGNGIILVNAQNEAWADIAAYISRQSVGLVIFDTFARMSAGLEENSATDVGRAVRRFDRLKELTNSGVMVVHHTAKGAPDVARGSSALNGALDSELLIRNATWDISQVADANGRVTGKPIELWTSKQKNAEQLDDPIPLMMVPQKVTEETTAPLITGPNGNVDPMQGEVVLARPLPEPVVETAVRIREFVDRLTQQGATRSEIVLAVRPDAYARSRSDTAAYWKQRVAESVDRGLRYNLLETLTGTPAGSRYIPGANTPDQARAAAAAEVADQD